MGAPSHTFVGIDPELLASALRGDAEFELAARGWSCRLAMVAEEGGGLGVTVKEGIVTEVGTLDEVAGDHDLVWRGPLEDWASLFAAVPPPGLSMPPYDDRHSLRLSGDRARLLFPYYAAMLRLVALAREVTHGTTAEEAAAARGIPLADIQTDDRQVVGRYVTISAQGRAYRIYYEEAGTGDDVLLLQHTAGADARQWRHQLADPELAQRFRIVAYDLPFHGRSLPPEGVEWWTEPYALTTDLAVDLVLALMDALDIERPIFMGCSIGGHLAGDLALRHSERFRACIAVNGAVFTPNDPVLVSTWHDPTIGAQWRGASMYASTSPYSPEALRKEQSWLYSQGGPGVFVGDINYWARSHDLRDEPDDQEIACPLVVLVGEYDRVRQYDTHTPPTGPEALARKVRGATCTVLPGLGHFAPSEHPAAFKPHLVKVLDAVLGPST